MTKVIGLAKSLETAELAHFFTVYWANEYDIGDWADPPNQLSENAHGLAGWKGPYISKPLTWIDNPANNDLEMGALSNSPANWCCCGSCSFDLNRNGDQETTTGAALLLFGVNQRLAQGVDNTIDGNDASGDWSNRGKIKHDGSSLAIHIAVQTAQ